MGDSALVNAAIRVVELAAGTSDRSCVSAKLLNHAEQYLLRCWSACRMCNGTGVIDTTTELNERFRTCKPCPDCSDNELPQAHVVAPGFADGID